jgi:uncharacterized membrane protein
VVSNQKSQKLIKQMKKFGPNLLIALFLLLMPLGYAAYIYSTLDPNKQIPTHFNINGIADAWGSRETIFLGPGIMAAVGLFTYLILSNLKNIDPKRYKAEDDGMFKKFALFMVLFLSILGVIITQSATNNNGNITKILLPFIGLAFAAMGWYMPKLHQNYFAGFKLPWTLENVDNWNATHKLAGKVWLYGGILQAFATLVLPNKLALIAFLAIVFVMVIVPTIFSYRMFKKGNHINE